MHTQYAPSVQSLHDALRLLGYPLPDTTNMKDAMRDIGILLNHVAEMTEEDWRDIASTFRDLARDAEKAELTTRIHRVHKDDYVGPFLPPEPVSLFGSVR